MFFELLYKLLKYDPDDRMLARQALKDPYFRDLREAEKQNGPIQPACDGDAKHPTDERPPRISNMREDLVVAPEEDIPPVNTHAVQAESLGNMSQSGRYVEDVGGKLPPIGLNNKKEKNHTVLQELSSVRKREEKKRRRLVSNCRACDSPKPRGFFFRSTIARKKSDEPNFAI